ncbi:unnamed protein product [Orchesella dallaii]|uniref:Uncharacterized protein n=1 Tax=Orchesella dallaii TaxID=48710 RepID=A0ABP1PUL8_9HEXA
MDGENSETVRGEISKDLPSNSTPIEPTKQYQEFSVTMIDALDIVIEKYQDDLKKLSEKIQIERRKLPLEVATLSMEITKVTTCQGEGKIGVLILKLPEDEILKDWTAIKSGLMMTDQSMSSEDEDENSADSS